MDNFKKLILSERTIVVQTIFRVIHQYHLLFFFFSLTLSFRFYPSRTLQMIPIITSSQNQHTGP